MTDLATKKDIRTINGADIAIGYQWFYTNLYKKLVENSEKFFGRPFSIRFMGVSSDENILFYGDEYFVNKLPITSSADFNVKISADVIKFLLDEALGASENKFNLNNLTDIEAGVIKSYIIRLYKGVQENLVKQELPKQLVQNYENLNFTFFIREGEKHIGKIIFRIPEYVIPKIEPVKRNEVFSIDDFKTTKALLKLKLGSTKISLTDIKNIENGDIIVLENSNINKMSVVWKDAETQFNINPNPSLIISINSNGGNEMEEETSTKSQNMWDSILVDVVAEFDNVKLTLGELKQISEGLVIDVGSVYENKIKLRVENQIVATGELVILNDRYGVRIEEVKKSKEIKSSKQADAAPQAKKAAAVQPQAKKEKQPDSAKQGDENFDYSDFEIEDESI